MKYEYRTSGTCSRAIYLDVEDGIVKDVEFYGGCHGNLQGIAALVKDMKAEDVIARVKGIKCGNKSTSCPEQLALALEEMMGK